MYVFPKLELLDYIVVLLLILKVISLLFSIGAIVLGGFFFFHINILVPEPIVRDTDYFGFVSKLQELKKKFFFFCTCGFDIPAFMSGYNFFNLPSWVQF